MSRAKMMRVERVRDAAGIGERNANDSPMLPALVKKTAENFTVAEVSADKAYASMKNMDTIMELGGTPFIPFKIVHTGRGTHKNRGAETGAWAKAFGYFMYRRDDFMAHNHKRSNVETTFSMMKRKFGDYLRSKTDAAMVNETMCKVLAHNLVVLIHEMFELGIDPTAFGWDSPAPALEPPHELGF